MCILVPQVSGIALFLWRICSLGSKSGEDFPVISQTFLKIAADIISFWNALYTCQTK